MREIYTRSNLSTRMDCAMRLALTLALAVLAAFGGSIASAAEIEEIIVSARATEQSVRDIPVSVTAFSEETMENMEAAVSL